MKWNETKLGKMTQELRELYVPSQQESIPYIGLEHISQGELNLIGLGISNEIVSSKKIFKQGDILFGTLRPYFRKVVKPTFDGVCSTDITVLRARKGYSQDFLFYLLASQPLIDYASVISNGTKMPRAKWKVLAKTDWMIPALPEQERIASILSAYDNLIEVNNKRIALLEQMAAQIYKEWFVRMRFPGYENTEFEKGIPKGWEIKKLSDIIKLSYGKSLLEEKRDGGGFPVYGSSGIVGFHSNASVKGPGIIVGRKGNVGSVFYSHTDFYAIDTVYYVETKHSLIYIFYLLNTMNFISGDAAVPGLNRGQAYSNKIFLPGNNLIEEFHNLLFPIFEQIKNLKEQVILLKQTRDLLLPRLISGKLRVKGLIDNDQNLN